jgi:hypothetical protein
MPARRRLENGDITGINPGTPDRVDKWVRTAVSVRGWPRWVFIKVHTHGTIERNTSLLLSPEGAGLYADLLSRYNDGDRYVVHFVTAWQMYRCVRALESGDREAMRRIEDFDYAFTPAGRDGSPRADRRQNQIRYVSRWSSFHIALDGMLNIIKVYLRATPVRGGGGCPACTDLAVVGVKVPHSTQWFPGRSVES